MSEKEERLVADNRQLRALLVQAGADAEASEADISRLRELLVQAGADAAASDAANQVRKTLIAELRHRVKNLLATVLAISNQTLKSSTSVADAQTALRSRIMALSRSYDLLHQDLDAAPLRPVVENAVEPYNADGRFTISLPEVMVGASKVLSLSLMLNELCTNAVKYGSLSADRGGWKSVEQ
ncbi:MAG: sensor histidine kinase [Hyphomicrobiaceae bacterium]|nr:sensor histidine kinase [Hyphomicrobiaceae bacterium]